MSKKITLLFVDGDCLKIVYGDKLKCIKFGEVGLEHNSDFLDRIFRNTQVVKVDKVTSVDRGSFDEFSMARAAEPEPKQAEKAAPAASDPITDQPRPQQPAGFAPQDGGDVYVVSMAKMTFTIDDVNTGQKIMREGANEFMRLVLRPGQPVNLSSLEQKSLKTSNILPRLLKNGTIRQVSYDEAMSMMAEYDKQAQEVISALDGPGVGIIGDGATGSAAKAAKGMFSSEGEVVAEPMEISALGVAPQADMKSASNENSMSMENLMQMIAEDEASGTLEAPKNEFTGIKHAGGSQ